MNLTDWLTRTKASPDRTPVNTTAGESTSLLTQTAGAIFGFMPALMSKAANAVPAQHVSRSDGALSAGDNHSALGATDHAYASTVGTSLGHALPVAAVYDGHEAAQTAPHAVQNEQANGFEQAHASHGAHGSSATPQQLHLPDTAQDGPHGSPFAASAASDPHMQPEPMHSDLMPASIAQSATAQSVSAQGAVMQMAEDREGVLHLGNLTAGPSHDAFHALDGAVAFIGETAGAALGRLQSDVSQSLSHVTDSVGHTLSTVDQITGNVAHLGSELGSLTHGLQDDLSQTVISIGSVVPNTLSAVDQIVGTSSHHGLPADGGGDAGSHALDRTALLSTVAHSALDAVVGHVGASPSTVATHADAPTPPNASLSDIGHPASLTSDGSPLHVPLIGQSYMDHDVGHDLGFSLHALHGI